MSNSLNDIKNVGLESVLLSTCLVKHIMIVAEQPRGKTLTEFEWRARDIATTNIGVI